ncbi:ABC transporter permease [Sphingomonas profundi]|uniref:ABC transporter permease n=1 Tax=Alterirhizorhabdus profundi TaxID=2681549 RepID=UPI0012E6F20D|nr:ABC transporter permease [Sphingomonas profundi]
MNQILRAALVIARRDYVASVWSRTFLLFLVGPLLPIAAGLFFGTIGSGSDRQATHPRVAVIAAGQDARLIGTARHALAARLGADALPDLSFASPERDAERQTRALLREGGAFAVLRGGLDKPLLLGPRGQLAENGRTVALILDQARMLRALGAAAPPPVPLMARAIGAAPRDDAQARMLTARMGQLLLMLLTMILAGMLLSNLIEEKSNKVIEVLAAAVPVDAIFIGKLLAMLAMSLTGIAVWGGAATVALFAFAPQAAAALPAPAVGWPAFLMLGTLYFVMCYLLLGSLFLGIGAQAATVREVQTLSMPVTMAQMGVVGLASTAVADPGGTLAMTAMAFPWSSPFAMLARAAQAPQLWPHLLAFGWQALWVAAIIRIAAGRFRRLVLKSGAPRKRLFARGR